MAARMRRSTAAGLLALCLAAASPSIAMASLSTLVGAAAAPLPPWRSIGVPGQKMAPTRFDVVDLEGERVLRIESRASYGNLVHTVPAGAAPAGSLSWRWRVDRPVAGADLRTKPGDDAAAKVCVLFDHALDRVPFTERQLLRLARAATPEPLPAATLCYVWAPELPAGTVLANAYTRRVRWMVLQGSAAPLAAWRSERRDLRADFLRAFGDEANELPPLSAVLVGGDADNTRGQGLAYLADLVLQ
jgi:Protein of unknown function (DUF3047)